MSIRAVKKVVASKPTLEGAGVRLRRAFGFGDTTDYDPFLLFDDFRNDNPADYLAGFPWHPHRGIETITYVLTGTVEHGDSLGNRGNLGAGDIQWMTAGSGILHQEMPKGDAQGRMHGFQLWSNLPASLKMTKPRYQDVKAQDIPEVTDDDGTKARIVVGEFWGKTGPVVGVFSSGDAHDSELWSYIEKLYSAYDRRAYQSVTVGVRLDGKGVVAEKGDVVAHKPLEKGDRLFMVARFTPHAPRGPP